MSEHWRPVVGHEGRYKVSDLGRVRSVDRIDSRGNRAWGRVLAPDVTASGHLRVALCVDGKARRHFVHRLVLAAFVGPRPDGMEACHNDGDPKNNVVGNLRWDTKSANARDRRRHGTDEHARKTHCPQKHPYDPSNTYYSAQGYRRCRICLLAGHKAKRDQARLEKVA